MKSLRWPALTLLALLCTAANPAAAAELKILLPLGRTAYQTNERIELAVVRINKAALPAGELLLKLQGEDASRLTFTFPAKKVEPAGGESRAVEHLYLNGRLLRPGKYLLDVSCDGASATQPLEVYSHLRRSSFRLINWIQRAGPLLPLGEDNLGYNLYYGQHGQDREGNLIRAGVDYMCNCTMSGGHQMDLRMECDWSDPLVIRGGTRRVVREAFQDRSRPNVPGVHFYDEPGLTWRKDPATGKDTPQGIPSQVRSYEAAFGEPPPDYLKLDPKDPEQARRWAHWARWKLGFMDAAWQDAQFGVRAVRPDYLSVTQSQYGWSAFTDGYYCTVVRSLPIISGHGGYHDFGPGYFNPSYFLEMARARDLARPNWYLPTWYGNTTPDLFRLEQYLAFQTNIQGMMSPPDLDPGDPAKSKAAAGIVASNHLMGRLGTIFTTMPPTRPPVAMLYSLSQMIHDQTLDRTISYAHETPHGRNLMFTYLAGKLLQQPLLAIVDEDIRDGTLAAQHKAVILTSLDYLDPEVVAGLEAFVKQGGLVLATGDCKVQIKGAVSLRVTPQFPDAAKIASLEKTRKDLQAAKEDKEAAKVQQEIGKLMSLRAALAGAQKLAHALRPQLEKAGIPPVFVCDQPGIVATRQAAGDVEYLFAVNATHDPRGDPMLGIKAVTAKITFQDAGPIYDAVHGGWVPEGLRGGMTPYEGTFRFGPGEMRVFARTKKPILGVKAALPVLHRDYSLREQPLCLDVGAVVLGKNDILRMRTNQSGRPSTSPYAVAGTEPVLLSGSIPLRVQLIDPLGAVRYDLYRATDHGSLNLSLPLGLNDPAGKYTVKVTELLANTEDTATVEVPAVPTCNIAAGAARRAIHLSQDRANVFRFFRTHHKVTIVKGAGDYDAAAARLVKILKPWNVEGAVVKAADVNRPRPISEEEAQTWVGLEFAGKGQIKAGDKNNPVLVGFAVQGPVILLGTPEDNPLTKALLDWRFLPYSPKKGELPGPGRGLVAWQRDGLAALQESITLIAHDPAGMAEAVGTMYEMLAGMEPLTPWTLARESTIVPATSAKKTPEPAVAWSVVLPDAVVGIKAAGDTGLSVLTHAGEWLELQRDGTITGRQVLEGPAYEKAAQGLAVPAAPAALAAAQKKAPPGRLVKLLVMQDGQTAVAYWGGRVEVFAKDGRLRAARGFPQDVTALTWAGRRLIVGDADGRLTALDVK
jgi:hypothetical protein